MQQSRLDNLSSQIFEVRISEVPLYYELDSAIFVDYYHQLRRKIAKCT